MLLILLITCKSWKSVYRCADIPRQLSCDRIKKATRSCFGQGHDNSTRHGMCFCVAVQAFGVFYFSSFLVVVVSYIVLIGIAATAADIVIGSGGCCQLSKEFNQKVCAVDIVDHMHKLEKCMPVR